MPFKAVILLRRKEGLSHEEFEDWWVNRHSPLARKLPGLRKLCFNLVKDGEAAGYDGVAELWFDSHDAFEAGYASDVGQAVAADSLSMVSERKRMLVEEIHFEPLG